mgnify:CR=1 FL=1
MKSSSVNFLQAMYLARAEMRSEDRDKYIEHKKRAGKFEADFDLV